VRNFAYGFVAAVLALTLGSIAYFAFGFAQVRADQKPSALEKIILGSAVRASVRRAAAKIPPAPSKIACWPVENSMWQDARVVTVRWRDPLGRTAVFFLRRLSFLTSERSMQSPNSTGLLNTEYA
jgi:ABC-type phosphate transport system substrate-binding protein